MPYFVYILLCQDGTFYTGYTKDVEARAKLHVMGRGAKYTKIHPPQEVSYVETFASRSEAMRRERTIKKLSHQQKQKLIAPHETKKQVQSLGESDKPTPHQRKKTICDSNPRKRHSQNSK
jgi:putative endonuclease